MSLVMLALQQKVIGCHFCHQFILGAVGSLALSSSLHSLQSKFASKIDANNYFIAVVINAYLTTTLHAFTSNARKSLKRKTQQAKLQ
jgi:cytochrome c551/c552